MYSINGEAAHDSYKYLIELYKRSGKQGYDPMEKALPLMKPAAEPL